ncbi:hypothetical protein PIB30_038493 [Stylosanthes scabra]|uniref:Uncharacterized protein n=1 Tax=Stylosanthes scabra TaxID=79078 RepID=A0ABU6RE34_9FABA|nr:hypothetical protein [Stylosanthes scabra]
MRPIGPFSQRLAASPISSTSSGSTGSVHRERERAPRTPLTLMAPAPAPGPMYPIPCTPMCDARRYRSLFPRRRVAPPTPPPPSPPSSDDEPSVETYDPATELVSDPDEPYVAKQVPYGAPEAYYSDASYGSERENASADTAPSSHHSSGSCSGSVSLGYRSASSGSASDGASDDDPVGDLSWGRVQTSRVSSALYSSFYEVWSLKDTLAENHARAEEHLRRMEEMQWQMTAFYDPRCPASNATAGGSGSTTAPPLPACPPPRHPDQEDDDDDDYENA